MKAFSPKHSKKVDQRQAEREARKAANGQAAFFANAELSFIGPDGSNYYTHKPVKVEGYTHSF